MKKLYLFSIAMTIIASSPAQWLAQSEEGKGSFLFKGTNISVDLVKADVSFTLNNLLSPVKLSKNSDNHFLFFGTSLGARNEEGLANIFSGNKFVPTARMGAYLGFQLTNSFNKLYKSEEERLNGQIMKVKSQHQNIFVSKMNGKIDEEILSSPLHDSAVIKKIRKEWKEKLSKSSPQSFLEFLKAYKPDNVAVANIIPDLLSEIESIARKHARELEQVRSLLTEDSEENISNKLWRFSIFSFGGVQASSFTRVEYANGNNSSINLIDEEYTGGNWGIGVNYQIEKWKFGATYAYRKANNFELLDKAVYKSTGSASTGAQTLSQEKQIFAYSGNYTDVEINDLNADIFYTLDLGNSSNIFLLLNGYFRGEFFSRNADLLPSSYNIGLGSYFFAKRSAFLGGFYVELVDAGNDYEKARITTQTTGAEFRRLTFGIVLKLGLNAIMSSQ